MVLTIKILIPHFPLQLTPYHLSLLPKHWMAACLTKARQNYVYLNLEVPWVEISKAYLKVFGHFTRESRIWALFWIYLKIINNFMDNRGFSRKNKRELRMFAKDLKQKGKRRRDPPFTTSYKYQEVCPASPQKDHHIHFTEENEASKS